MLSDKRGLCTIPTQIILQPPTCPACAGEGRHGIPEASAEGESRKNSAKRNKKRSEHGPPCFLAVPQLPAHQRPEPCPLREHGRGGFACYCDLPATRRPLSLGPAVRELATPHLRPRNARPWCQIHSQKPRSPFINKGTTPTPVPHPDASFLKGKPRTPAPAPAPSSGVPPQRCAPLARRPGRAAHACCCVPVQFTPADTRRPRLYTSFICPACFPYAAFKTSGTASWYQQLS